jgi:two-component system, cell cycle sensor histidine kinase and response regulator CckA
MGTSGHGRQIPAEQGPPNFPSESSHRFPRIYTVVLALCALAGTAMTVWVLRNEYARELNYWSERLTRVADTNTLLFKLWIQQRSKEAETVASFPAVKASVSGLAGKEPAESAQTHLSVILDLVRDPGIYSALYVLDEKGKVVASSSGALLPEPEILETYRSFGDVGILTLFEPGKDAGFPPLAVIAPIRGPIGVGNPRSASSEIVGAVILVTRREVLIPLFLTDVATTASGETVFVARRGKKAVFVSPFRNRPQEEAGLPKPPTPGKPGLLALEGREGFVEFSDYRGIPVVAVTRFIPEIGWGMVTKIDHKEALSRFRQTFVQDFSILFVSLGALVSLAFALWRHQQVHGLRAEITRRRQTEEELQQSERRFFTAFRSSPEGMSISTLKEGRYIEANDIFLRTLGYTREELIGKTSTELGIWARPEDRNAMIQKLQCGELVREIELNARTQSGQIRHVLLSLETIRLQDELCLLASLRDITEHKLLEEELRQAQKMEAVGRLAGGVAHDFNNLLGIMMGYSELLFERLSGNDPNRKTVEHILDAARRASEVTRQLLAFSRRQVLQTKVVDLNAVVCDAEKLLHRLIGEDIELVMRLGADSGYVMADPGQLVQVIMNLAVNSRDAMAGGGRLTVETANVVVDEAYAQTHWPQKPGAFVMLAVTDTGHGLDENTQAHLFEPFFTTKEVGKGTGLGLSTVYGIVKQSGGFIWAESKPGEGTTFRVYLPRVARPGKQEEHTEPPRGLVGGSETILIVEDEPLLRGMTRESLETAGYRVLEAADVHDAIRIAEQHKEPIHMLVTDLVMPKMSGPALAQKVREIRTGIRVIYVSGHTDSSLVQHQLLEENASFLQKPYSRQALLQEIHRLLMIEKQQ